MVGLDELRNQKTTFTSIESLKYSARKNLESDKNRRS